MFVYHVCTLARIGKQSSICNRDQRFTQHFEVTAFIVKVDESVLINEAIVSSGISMRIY
jgi:hypothetical protein